MPPRGKKNGRQIGSFYVGLVVVYEGDAQPTDPREFKWRGNRLCCHNECGCVLTLRNPQFVVEDGWP